MSSKLGKNAEQTIHIINQAFLQETVNERKV